jgi:hypothetical protein
MATSIQSTARHIVSRELLNGRFKNPNVTQELAITIASIGIPSNDLTFELHALRDFVMYQIGPSIKIIDNIAINTRGITRISHPAMH